MYLGKWSIETQGGVGLAGLAGGLAYRFSRWTWIIMLLCKVGWKEGPPENQRGPQEDLEVDKGPRNGYK